MAARRRVGNLMGLAVLSAVAYRDMHPYEMAQALRGWGKEGRAELVDWTRELLSVAEAERPRFRAGLSVMAVLSPGEVTSLLQQRLAAVEDEIEAARAELAGHGPTVPRLFLVEIEYDVAIPTAEAAWMRALIGELTSGTLPGLDDWERHHRDRQPRTRPKTRPEGGNHRISGLRLVVHDRERR